MQEFGHSTVLLNEAVTALNIKPSGNYVDGTFGRGGHARKILQNLNQDGRLWVIDKDPVAIAHAQALQESDKRVHIYRGSFADLMALATEHELVGCIDGVLLDLGISSPQVDDPERGFSFMNDGPLDMRMDPESGRSAAEWLNQADEDEIAQVIKQYGEEKFGKRIAHAIVAARKEHPITRTTELVALIEQAIPVKDKYKHPATRTFQGIRIFINRELDDLKNCLDDVINVLASGGRLAVISFHSLEDRLVKRFMRDQSRGDQYPVGLPIQETELNKKITIIGKAQKASADEVEQNQRARSAVLRVAERI